MKPRGWLAWWSADVNRLWLFVGGLIYAAFFGQGVPLWDDDFTSWFSKVHDKTLLQIIGQWLSPISTEPDTWGFSERQLQELIYKILYWISGYDSSIYMVFKGLVLALLGVMLYQWGLRLVPSTAGGRMAALAAAIAVMIMPGPMVAYLWHCDYAPVAELLLLVLTYVAWSAIENTPREFAGWPRLGNPDHRRWLGRWAILALCTYLAYDSKANVKLIPVILAIYVVLVRRRQVWFFAWPIGLMVLLAIPWGRTTFHRLPPFVPGSAGSAVGWMWQPASLSRLSEFFWSSQGHTWRQTVSEPTMSLAALLGPFLLAGIVMFLAWMLFRGDTRTWHWWATPIERARLFSLIWCILALLAVSALPGIGYGFRVRYAIIPLVPIALLLAWVFGLFASAWRRLPRWALVGAVCVLLAQCAMNLTRSIEARSRTGRQMVAVDQAYDYVARELPTVRLTRLPDFLPFDYRHTAPAAILKKERVGTIAELAQGYTPYQTYALTWQPSLWEQLEIVRSFNGCQPSVLFDHAFPCAPETGVHLLRFIGPDPLFVKGEAWRAAGDFAVARQAHEEFLRQHPNSLAGLFVVGLEALQQQDWARAEDAYARLERYLPQFVPGLLFRAIALEGLQQYGPAIDRLDRIVRSGTRDYVVCLHLYRSYRKSGQPARAAEVLSFIQEWFPHHPDLPRLLAEAGT